MSKLAHSSDEKTMNKIEDNYRRDSENPNFERNHPDNAPSTIGMDDKYAEAIIRLGKPDHLYFFWLAIFLILAGAAFLYSTLSLIVYLWGNHAI